MHILVNGIDLTLFTFDFYAVFNDSESFAVFTQFQKAEFNVDSLMFIHECNDLQKIVFTDKCKESVALANHIFETYVMFFLQVTVFFQ